METAAPAQAPADGAGSEQTMEDVYDAAFEQFLAPDSDTKTETQSATPPTKTVEPATEQADTPVETSTPEITDAQVQLLQRAHMTPEMIKGWTPEQREDFFSNAEKRESDQASFSRGKGDEVAELQRRLDKLEGKATEEQADETGETPSELGQQLDKVVTDLADTYGDEFKALAEPMQAIVKQNDQAMAQLQQQGQTLTIQNRIIVDMVVADGIRSLESDFPSLSEEKPRADVEAKFVELWKAADSPYRMGDGPFLQRVAKGIRAAAESSLGNKTEAAAQAALLDKTKQRLDQQPADGKGRTETKPLTEDQVYDEAFNEFLKEK